MTEILVVVNRKLGGEKLLDALRERAASGETSFRLLIPQSKPSASLVIDTEAVRESAQVRCEIALSLLARGGIHATGELGDPDPFSATLDAIAERRPEEIIVSTHPATRSGWLRRDLVERIRSASGLPVEHLVIDLEDEGLPFGVTLVLSAEISGGAPLIEHLKAKAARDPQHLFIALLPLRGRGALARREARTGLAAMLDQLHNAGLLSAGMIGDRDPYTAVSDTLELFTVDDLVICTPPGERSGWMRANLIERVRHATATKVEPIVVGQQAMTAAAAAAH